MKRYYIPASETRIEIKVINSRFIATAAPLFNIQAAKDFITRIKSEMSDASCHVPAYLIGYGASVIAHCSDAGEPAGTAGRPALAVLQGSGLGDIGVVVTRYFGGTKLGTGGLVRAYTDAVKEVLKELPRAVKVSTYTVMMTIPYALVNQIRLLITEHHGNILDEEFAGDVTISAMFIMERFPAFQAALKEFTRGSIEAVIIDTNHETIFPLDGTHADFLM